MHSLFYSNAKKLSFFSLLLYLFITGYLLSGCCNKGASSLAMHHHGQQNDQIALIEDEDPQEKRAKIKKMKPSFVEREVIKVVENKRNAKENADKSWKTKLKCKASKTKALALYGAQCGLVVGTMGAVPALVAAPLAPPLVGVAISAFVVGAVNGTILGLIEGVRFMKELKNLTEEEPDLDVEEKLKRARQGTSIKSEGYHSL